MEVNKINKEQQKGKVQKQFEKPKVQVEPYFIKQDHTRAKDPGNGHKGHTKRKQT